MMCQFHIIFNVGFAHHLYHISSLSFGISYCARFDIFTENTLPHFFFFILVENIYEVNDFKGFSMLFHLAIYVLTEIHTKNGKPENTFKIMNSKNYKG